VTVSIGSKFGPYEVTAPAGAGGMGEVYKAQDSRLDRTVAIKVLTNQVADNPDLRQRFEREARAISSLNHPNICTLYDVGHEAGVDYLVMEYIEGETLTERLSKGPMTADELLRVAIQIADALDKAHRQGLVHRDLKPGNVMLTKEGAKLLDFGLAKLQMSNGVVAGISGITQTTPLTGAGSIIGTIQYMSPEQLEGKEADARSDIFAFGAVLYEMATGKRAFEGSSQASLIASILKEQPKPITEIEAVSPPMLDRAIRQCLAKDPDQRWQTAGDLKRALQWIAEGGSQAGIPAVISKRRRWRERTSWIVAGAAILVAAAIGTLWLTRTMPEPQVSRFTMETPAGISTAYWPKISPDGRLLSFHAVDSVGKDMIWIRPLNSLDAYPLAGTEGSDRQFWSPDSRYLAFFVRNQLKKIPVSGGPATLICEARGGSDGCWGSAGIILFDGNATDSIRQVSAAGGTVTAATYLDRKNGELFHAWPWFLPDGNHFFFVTPTDSTRRAGGQYRLMVGSLDSKASKSLFNVDARVAYSPDGYILYVKDGILLARPFDEKKLESAGEPVPLVQDVAGGWAANFSVSNNGILFCKTGSSGENSELTWYDRKGNELGKVGQPAGYGDVALSPDGDRLAYDLYDDAAQASDIWVYDLTRNVSSRLTFDDGQDIWPTWSPDGSEIVFASDRSGSFGIYRKRSNGMGEDQLLYATDSTQSGPDCWSPDGRWLTFQSIINGQWDFGIYDMQADSSNGFPFPSSFGETRATLSPGNRYIAYQSNESGRSEVYVRDLGKTGGKWQVSSGGGYSPKWRADGRELFFYTEKNDFMAVSVKLEPSFEIGIPIKLFSHTLNTTNVVRYRYDVSADGQKFILNVRTTQAEDGQFIVTQNWPQELKEH
jgi:serine/threonine protein kinase